MHTKNVSYLAGNVSLQGFLAHDPTIKAPSPAILIAHAWRGLDQFAKHKAVELAKLGYVAFAADVYGNGLAVETNEEALALMTPLYQNRTLLLERIKAGYDILKAHPLVDPKRIGGIGFCFGGLTIIELFRSGADLKGVAAFHAVLGNKGATVFPIAKGIRGSILVLHGNDDPLVSAEDLQNFRNEFTQAGIDWQMNIYGHTSHAFTNPEVNDPVSGLVYQAKSDRRSWQAMQNFFQEIFV